jgi:hypothetical protein
MGRSWKKAVILPSRLVMFAWGNLLGTSALRWTITFPFFISLSSILLLENMHVLHAILLLCFILFSCSARVLGRVVALICTCSSLEEVATTSGRPHLSFLNPFNTINLTITTTLASMAHPNTTARTEREKKVKAVLSESLVTPSLQRDTHISKLSQLSLRAVSMRPVIQASATSFSGRRARCHFSLLRC